MSSVFENETEWGIAQSDHVEVNISRPFKKGTLQKWDKSVPADYNFGITISIAKACSTSSNTEWRENLLSQYAQALATIIKGPVFHHRTRLASGKNIQRDKKFR